MDLKRPLLEDWREYCQYLTSPDSFIDMSFYYLIGAALQRRVWIGSCDMPIFANQFIILVGDPGMGKGIVIKPTTAIMKHHKLHMPSYEEKLKPKKEEYTPEKLKEIEEFIKLIEETRKDQKPKQHYLNDDPLLFPVAADATTYEALTEAHATSSRLFKVPAEFKTFYHEIVPPSCIYSHSSLSFLLEEMSSLFCKNADKLVKYLLVAWDCGDYLKATKHHGTDKIRNTCLSMLAGTTPGFMRDSFNDKLVDEGFSARAIIVYESKNRFALFGIPNYSDEQIEARRRILDRVKMLSTIFGQCSYTPEAHLYLKNYFEKELPNEKINDNVKLLPYYSKKVQHVQKLAMCIHFADFDDKTISLDTVKKALNVLALLEVNMHQALVSGGRNIQGIASRKIVKFLEKSREPKSIYNIWYELEGDIKESELHEVIRFLITSDQIESIKIENKNLYKIKEKK